MPHTLRKDRSQEIRTETAVLRKADLDIREGQARLLDQQNRLVELEAHGRPTREAERLVELMQQTLLEWERHRDLIVQRLAYLQEQATTSDEGDGGLPR